MSGNFIRRGAAVACLALLSSAGHTQTADAPDAEPAFFVLQITFLEDPRQVTIRASSDGRIDRWHSAGGRVSRVGIAQMLPPVTAPVVALADSVPPGNAMGDGTREGDIWVLTTQPDGETRAVLEPLAPEPLRRLVERAERLSHAIDMWPAKEHFLQAAPVAASRAERLRAAGLEAVAWDGLDSGAAALYERAAASPYELVPVPAKTLDAVIATVAAHDADGRDLYFELESSVWIQIGLWGPGSPLSHAIIPRRQSMKHFARYALSTALALAVLAPATSPAGTGKIRASGGPRLLDFCVSVRFDASAQELADIQRAFTDANEILADATDGAYEFGNIAIVNGAQGSREAEVFILPVEGRAYATCGLYGTPGEHITLYYSSNLVADPVADGDAYTIAHEFMHHVWGVKDEYSGPDGPAECEPVPGSPTASFCLLDNYFIRGGNDAMGTGTYTLDELCVASNHDPDLDTYEEAAWMQSCWERLATHPTRPVAAPAGLPENAAPAATPPAFRFPSAERRFVLCIDRSADETSQGDVRLNYAKQAANVFIELLPEGSELSVTSFADVATVDFPLTPVDSVSRQAAKDAVAALRARGATSIGAGIEAARDLIAAQGDVSCAQTIVLLTDGLGNTGVDELSLIPSLIESEISVVSIAVGASVSVANLQRLATDTGGRFLVLAGLADFAPLVSALSAEVVGGGVTSEIPGTVAEGDTVNSDVTVDTLMEDVTFVLVWSELTDDLDLFLVTPAGSLITFEDAIANGNITFISDEGSEIFIIEGAAVEEGVWGAFVTGADVEDGSFCLLIIDNLDEAVVVGAPGRPTYELGQEMKLVATPRFRGNSVAGATVAGSFTRPDGSTGSLTYFDDGNPANGDDIADDGIYSALFSDFNGVTGAYSFDFEVENVSGTTYGGESHYGSVGAPIFSEPAPPFVRLATASAVVSAENTAPLVDCSGIVGVECGSGEAPPSGGGSIGVVEASVFDANGDALTVVWTVDGDVVQTDDVPGGDPPTQALVQLVWSYEPGVHAVSAAVSDGQGTTSCASTVTVADELGPDFETVLSHTVLWPPNHELVDVTATVTTLGDDCDAEPRFELTSIRSNEAGEEEDIVGAEFGTPDTEFQLRAEREGDGDGREYTITFTAFDAAGNATEHVSVVLVPHNYFVSVPIGDDEGFDADGTALRPDAERYLLVVPGDSEVIVDPASARVGNQDGTTRPLAFYSENVVGDERADMILEFDAARTRALRQASPDPLGLSFLTSTNAFHWSSDIFALGPPITIQLVTDVPDGLETPDPSTNVDLYRPVPNPFRIDSRLAYSVPAPGAEVEIAVFDVGGRRVRQLASGVHPGGLHQVAWDGRNGANRPVPSGVYFFRIVIGEERRTVRVTLLR